MQYNARHDRFPYRIYCIVSNSFLCNALAAHEWRNKVSGALVQSFDGGPPSILNQNKI